MSKPPLNSDQQTAIDDICKAAISGKKEFFLTGGPGVGKTFTTREIAGSISKALSRYNTALRKNVPNRDVVLTSTTNKASNVLAGETGLPVSTIHSFLGVVPKTNYTTGEVTLRRTTSCKVHSNIILIVDEASMIDTALYNIIQECTDPSCFVIFVGDKNQLPPIKEELSPVVKLSGDPALHYEITTPVRNASAPALMGLCERLRQDIQNETPRDYLTHWASEPGQIEFVDGAQLQSLVNSTFGLGGTVKPDDPEQACRILCYTNKSVLGYNSHIRALRQMPTTPVAGEFLISNSHYSVGPKKNLPVEIMLEILKVSSPFEHRLNAYMTLEMLEVEVCPENGVAFTAKVARDKDKFNDALKALKKAKNWSTFYQLKEGTLDLRDREACTVHKAQGSTHDSVVINMRDIFTCTNPNTLRRMLYVAASRARNKIYVYDENIHANERGIYR